MTCEDFREVAGAYALGALDPDERAPCDAHLAEPTHQGCPEALDQARAVLAAILSSLPPVRPDEAVWRAVEVRAGIDAGPRRPVSIGWIGWAAAAAASVLLVLWQGARLDAQRLREAEGRLEAERARSPERELAALLGEPASRVVLLSAVPGRSGRAAAVVNLAMRRAVIVTANLEDRPGKDWQLWVLRGTNPPVPAGFLRFVGAGVAVGEVDPSLLGAAPDALAVSLEPAGGSPAPTEVHLVGKLSG